MGRKSKKLRKRLAVAEKRETALREIIRMVWPFLDTQRQAFVGAARQEIDRKYPYED